MGILQDKVAIVTGGTRGIGKAIVEHFAAEGAKVLFTYAGSVDRAKVIEETANQKGHTVKSMQANAAELAAAQNVVDAAIETFGQLDAVVNNAGITRDNLLMRMNEQQWDEVIETNLKSVFNYTKAATKPMMRQRSGAFVNIGSVVGVGGNAGQANYAASKAGIIGFSKSVAQELGSRNIRTNVVAPGFIETEMTQEIPEAELKKWLENIPMKRAGKAEEVAQLCAFLASDGAQYITGQVIGINGGMN